MNGKIGRMANRSTFPLVDRLMDTPLAERLKTWRAEGLSFETIADRIRDEADVTVSSSTVRRWCDEEAA